MKEGAVVLIPLPQADGRTKPRPAVLLRKMPPFGDWLLCGVSTQLHPEGVGFDERLVPEQPDFHRCGLKAASVIRLGFLAVLPEDQVLGVLGAISSDRHCQLLERLASFLMPTILPEGREGRRGGR